MSSFPVSSINVVYPPGKYYIGDICYALPRSIYHGWWGKQYNYQVGTYVTHYKNISGNFSMNYTTWGDGTYIDEINGHKFMVDSGVIGITSYELCSQKKIKKGLLCANGIVIESSTDVHFDAHDGVFTVIYNDNKDNVDMIVINTRDLSDFEFSDDSENSSASNIAVK
jgi:hypothetical protein